MSHTNSNSVALYGGNKEIMAWTIRLMKRNRPNVSKIMMRRQKNVWSEKKNHVTCTKGERGKTS